MNKSTVYVLNVYMYLHFASLCCTIITKAEVNDTSLQWHHNGRDGVPTHRRFDCSLNRLFSRRLKKASNSSSLAFERKIHRWIPHTKGQWRGECFHFFIRWCHYVNLTLVEPLPLLFSERKDFLAQNLVKPRSGEIPVYIFTIDLKFDTHLDSNAVEMSVKCQSDTCIVM